MNSDSAFYIGKTHQVCQDYAKHFPGIAVISDGCSSSSNTDWGARLLTLTASQELLTSEFNPNSVITKTERHASGLGLETTCLDATLLYALVKDGSYKLRCFGDGVFAKIRKDGTVEISEIEFSSGAPYYLSYQLSETRLKQYLEKFGFNKIIKQYTILDGKIKNFMVTEDQDPSILGFSETGSIKDYVALVVMSDGILSFQQSTTTETSKVVAPIKIEEVLVQALGFKNYFGSFVQRRMQAFRKECEKKNWFATDDLSMGAVYCGD